ncbi:unnamed protein product [Strongylus vulgaris]|uniref:Uncharacterized protein n=1 Tax=Strongylus vulgaris TaxID=40348 RepID=A0A3P7L639_STRVU|nr:unnamed protein product [Strongylus vulgaris]
MLEEVNEVGKQIGPEEDSVHEERFLRGLGSRGRLLTYISGVLRAAWAAFGPSKGSHRPADGPRAPIPPVRFNCSPCALLRCRDVA